MKNQVTFSKILQFINETPYPTQFSSPWKFNPTVILKASPIDFQVEFFQ